MKPLSGNLRCFSQTDNARYIQCARAQLVFLSAAVEQRPSLYTFAAPTDIKRADALWTIQFMGTQAEQIGPCFADIDLDFPNGLGGIAKEQGLMLAGEFGDTRYGMQHAGFIIGMHKRDQYRVWADSRLQRIHVDTAIAGDRQVGYLSS